MTTTPEQVAIALAFEPTRSHRIGDQVGSKAHIRHKQHVFMWQPDVLRSAELSVHLAAICDRVEPIVERIPQLPDCSADIFCGYSSESGQGGTSLSPGLLERLARVGLKVVLDLYPPPADSQTAVDA